MKNNKKDSFPKDKKALKNAPATSPAKDRQGGANTNFPQEYEEQIGEDIRMVPQPFVKPKKTKLK